MCRLVGMSLSGYVVGGIDRYMSSCSDVVEYRLVSI